MRDFDFAEAVRDTGLGENFSAGVSVFGAGMLTERLAAAGEFGFSRWTTGNIVFEDELLLDGTANIYTFLGGPRVYGRFARATAFGQVLFGAARTSGDICSSPVPFASTTTSH